MTRLGAAVLIVAAAMGCDPRLARSRESVGDDALPVGHVPVPLLAPGPVEPMAGRSNAIVGGAGDRRIGDYEIFLPSYFADVGPQTWASGGR